MKDRFFYFGCIGSAGHYLWNTSHAKYSNPEPDHPWKREIDGKLCPQLSPQTEGVANLFVKDGWTAIAFWDRTVDKRPGSHSTYIAQGEFDFAEMVMMARHYFPKRWDAMTFTVDRLGALGPGEAFLTPEGFKELKAKARDELRAANAAGELSDDVFKFLWIFTGEKVG